jgi:hypothetical protein
MEESNIFVLALSVASLAFSRLSCSVSLLICSISLLSCYGFAGLRLHPLFVLHLALLVAGIASPIEHRQPLSPLTRASCPATLTNPMGDRGGQTD